jgi:hypothetical protein
MPTLIFGEHFCKFGHFGCWNYLLYGELGLHQGLFVNKSGFNNVTTHPLTSPQVP